MTAHQFRFKVGFVGAGNMAEAICRSLINDAFYKPAQIAAYDPSTDRTQHFKSKYGVYIAQDNASLVDNSENILLAVKPQAIPAVMEQIKPVLGPGQLVISIAAGISTHYLETALDKPVPVVRIMPNTPLMIGAGTTALCRGKYATQEHLNFARTLFASAGVTLTVEESMMNAITAISGSGPAYFFYLIEAMVQAGVEMGLSQDDALKLAANTALGSAKMVLAEHAPSPEELRRRVTSPGGTTLSAITVMDQANMKQTLIQAMHAAAKRSAELGK